MAKTDGKFVVVDVTPSGGAEVTLLGQTSGSLEYSIDPLETTDKLSKDPSTGVTHKSYIGGHRDGTITVEGQTDDSASGGWPSLYAIYMAGGANNAKATIKYGDEQVGGKFYSQDAILTSFSRSDADNEISTYSATFQKVGAPTEGTTSS